MTRYIESLPEGLESHPDAKTKASVLRSMLNERSVEAAEVQDLPESVARLILEPPPVSSWILEAQCNAALLALQDLSGLDEATYFDMVYARMRALFEGPLYRILFSLSSPRFLLRSAAYRWRSFHKGTEFKVSKGSPTDVEVRIAYPHNLWNEDCARGLLTSLRAPLDLCGAIEPHLELAEVGPEALRMVGRWGDPG